MKVIDLLNKIANGEQPNHIIFDTDDWYWGYDSYIPKSFLETSPDVQATVSLFKKYRIDYALNKEIEIIEKPKKIKKIDTDRYKYKLTLGYNYNYMCDNFQEIEDEFKRTQDKLNEIIDYINKGE